jgi:hypothetical protein
MCEIHVVVYAVFIFARYVGCLDKSAYWVRCIAMLCVQIIMFFGC